jgi:hypothetical protein
MALAAIAGDATIMRTISALAVLVLLAGCATSATNNVTAYSHVDPTAKTALVPPGGDGVLGSLKWALASDGWKLRISDGVQKVAATQGADVDAKAAADGEARYTFAVDQAAMNVCAPGATAFLGYTITVVDNKTGATVTSIKGQGSVKEMREKMADLVSHL